MTIQINPVAMRESRAMWRGARSFLLLLCYAGALSLVAFLAYNSEVSYAYRVADGGQVEVQSARVGHTLFIALSMVQLVAWMLIAPALSATSVSSERERGLLESLLMSNLHPRQIIAGKFSVSASFLGILIVATLPVLAICFMLGGVSPLEFGAAFAIQIATAFLALALGIWCSTVARLSTHALGAAFCSLVAWIALTFLSACMADGWFRYSGLHDFLQLFSMTNPIFGFMFLVESNGSNQSFQPFGIEAAALWPLCVAAQVLAGGIFLRLASRHLSRPLSHEDAPEPARRSRRSRRSHEAAGESVALLEGEPNFAGARTDDGHFEVPILKNIVFGGPLMRHHLRAAWRWKMPRGRTLKLWKTNATIFLLVHAFAVLKMLSYGREGESWLAAICLFVALAIPVYVAASAGLSIARERELGAWNHLRLADLKPREIASAKMLAPIVAGLGYASVLLPLALFSWLAMRNYYNHNNAYYNYDYDYQTRTVKFIALGLPIWLLGLVQLSGWASICSLRAKRSSIALVASFAGALIFLVGVPVVMELSYSGSYSDHHTFQQFFGLFHPFYALITASDLIGYDNSFRHPDLYALSLLTHSAIAFALYHKVAQAIARREK